MYTLALPAPQITVPKFRLNNNLLRLISVILLCVMVFLAVEAIAQVCQSERNALNVALAWQAAALVAVIAAEGALVVAIASANPIAIAVALAFLLAAEAGLSAAMLQVIVADQEYWDCMQNAGAG